MARIKISRKKLLQEPDEFLSLSQRVWLWVHDNQGRTAAIAGGVVAAALVLVGGKALLQKRAETRVNEVARTVERFAAPPAGTPAPDISRDLAELAKKYAGTTEGAVAQYFLGVQLAAKGEHAQAAEAFAALERSAPGDGELGTLARVAAGYLSLARGESDRALEIFQKLVQETGKVVPRAQLQLEIGGLLEKKANLAEARRVYLEVGQQYPGSTWKAKAGERLRHLDALAKSAS